MSTYYNFYTEAKINGEWHDIDPIGICVDHDGTICDMRYMTYWNGSRSYFGETYERLAEYGHRINFSDTSKEFREEHDSWDEKNMKYACLSAISLADLKRAMPKVPYEFCGVYKKSDVDSYRAGEIEDLYEKELTPEELVLYAQMDETGKKCYDYFEWSFYDSPHHNLPILLDAVEHRIKDFEALSFDRADDYRILMYIS